MSGVVGELDGVPLGMTGQNLDETRGARSAASSSPAILSDVVETKALPLFIRNLIVLAVNFSNGGVPETRSYGASSSLPCPIIRPTSCAC